MEDQIAITRIKHGDLTGLEDIVERYQVRAVQTAYLIVFDHALAEDIAQTAFIKVAEQIQQFDETRPFAPWFYRIVVNDALKATRKKHKTVSLEQNLDDESVAYIAKCLASPELSPEQCIEQDELREKILAAVGSLSPEQRAVIVMRYFLDLSQADMSSRLNRPLSTIKWWLRDAHKRLRGLLEGLR
jgi:RNA polymerase sigma-70 factor (ECF subfamily)